MNFVPEIRLTNHIEAAPRSFDSQLDSSRPRYGREFSDPIDREVG